MLTEEEKNAGLVGRIIPINIEEQMKSAYIDYSMSVIVSRALPDVRDGMKPVHRRILYDMSAELNLYSDKPTRKSARIVGDVLGKFHPHGDSSVYDAMVRMAQEWSLRYPLIFGQGNFGSMDGDSPAAMRYTEARMRKITDEVMADIDKETVDWTLNFDDTIPEPTVLPTKIPLLIVNGASGIAVGMATNMAPHNLREVVDACCAYIDNPEITGEELLHYVKGPDFPTGGSIDVAKYNDGQRGGTVKVRAKIEKLDQKTIVIREIPFSKTTSTLIDSILKAIEKGKIKAKKVDDNTVQFVLTRPEAPFLADLAMDFASILSKEYADAMMKAGTPEKLDLNPIGTGPFQLQQYQKDSRIRYKAFDGYWGTKPQIDTLVFSITPDASVRYAKLQKNECQVMPYPNPADIARMKQDKSINLMEMPGLNVGYLSYNVQKKPLDDVKVRQALTYAVNKDAIIKAVYQGAGVSAKNLIPPTMWGYNDDVQDYTYDPEKAKALLKEAGLEKGFSIDLWAMPVQRPYNPNARRMAEMIQADWAKVGVQAKIVTYEWGEYLKRAKDGEHQTVMMGWTGDNGDPDNFFATLFSCAASEQGSNYSKWCYKPFEDLIQPARATDDHNKRVELYKQAQVVMHDQAPALIIAHSTVFEPVRKEVKGYVVDPLGKHHFENVSIE